MLCFPAQYPKPRIGEQMFIAFSICNDEGQMKNGFALEVRSLTLAGIVKEGIQFDVHHLDGEQERLILGGTPYRALSMGKMSEHIMGIRMTAGYPATDVISKAEFRDRIGIGRVLNAQGDFA
jgi:hypothetical protein